MEFVNSFVFSPRSGSRSPLPRGMVRFGKLHLHPKVVKSDFSLTRRFCKFDWRGEWGLKFFERLVR